MADSNNTPILSQVEYKGTPYEDQRWERIGEEILSNDFLPLELEIAPSNMSQALDPMFEDFGGRTPAEGGRLQHCSPEERAQYRRDTATVVEDPNLIKVTAEQLEALKAEHFAKGHDAGLEEAVGQNLQKMAVLEGALERIFSDMRTQVSESLSYLEKETVKLALAVAERIIPFAVEINPEYIGRLVQEAISKGGNATIKRVRVSPQDLEFIEVVGVARYLKDQSSDWKFEADPSIKAGCIVETSAADLDYRLDAAFERVKEQVLKVIHE